MRCSPDLPDRANCFALVKYLPDPLGQYLNDLRADLVPNCHLRSHLTVLPPRSLNSCHAGWERLVEHLPACDPIRVELADIEVFEQTSVIYLAIAAGERELHRLHHHLAQKELAFREEYEYKPHITLAQGLTGRQVDEAKEHAKLRWRAFTGPRGFMLEALTFVQNTVRGEWLDLGEVELGALRLPANRTSPTEIPARTL